MKTTHKPPSSPLKQYINRYWTAHNPSDKQIEVPIVPDGCMDIIWRDGYLFLSGLMESAEVITINPRERLFVPHMGVSVKKFSKIVRFHEVHRVLSEEGLGNLCEKVLKKGYFDQAHFNRDFKKITGLKPSSELMSILYNT